jgi:hypothetical protein
MILSWNPPVKGPQGIEYVVLRREGAGKVERLAPGPLADTSFTDTRVKREREYCYRVLPIMRSGTVVTEGTPTAEVCARSEDRTPPAAPRDLTALAAGEGVTLTWFPVSVADVRGYNVYRAEEEGSFVKLNAEPVSAARYRDASAEAGVRYRYRVTAVDDSGRGNESAFSETVWAAAVR